MQPANESVAEKERRIKDRNKRLERKRIEKKRKQRDAERQERKRAMAVMRIEEDNYGIMDNEGSCEDLLNFKDSERDSLLSYMQSTA